MSITGDSDASVCVIGAGVAGLVTAKTLAQDGFDVQVVERDSSLGGTWASTRAYPGLRANNSKQTYEFSDFEYSEKSSTFPAAEEVREYLASYAEHFDVTSRILFDQEVVEVSRSLTDPNRLRVTFRSSQPPHQESVIDFDFVVVCNGVFHIPNIPKIDGADTFTGRILHSSDVRESTYKPGEKIVIIGGGKSAYDCAAWAARQALSPTLVYRRAQWMAPRYLPGGRIPGDWLMTSRFMSLFLRYYQAGTAPRLMHSIGKPLVRLWWTLIGLGWSKDLQIPKPLKPTERLPSGLEKVGVGGDFYVTLNEGAAAAVNGSMSQFHADGVELEDGTFLRADTVVFATGWRQNVALLSEELRQEIAPEGYCRLFRQILPPTTQNIGFVGYASSFSCTLTAEIAAHWLSEYFMGTLKLPDMEAMEKEVDRAHSWAGQNLPNRGTEGFIGPFISHYVDQLLNDLGLATKRESSFMKEYFTAFRASRIAGLSEERRLARLPSDSAGSPGDAFQIQKDETPRSTL